MKNAVTQRAHRLLLVLMLVMGSVPLLAATTTAQGDNAGKTVNLQLIVDASGSMAAPTDTGVVRMDAAKTVLNEVISQIPAAENVNVGLRVYGHRGNNTDAGRPESCQSSDLIVPMNGVDAGALSAQVNALQPVGWTPIGYSLQQAASDFTQPAGENVVNAIVMVTDGLETCDADPVAIAGDLKTSDQGITTHVIGFGTTPEEQAILSGIAEAGGGQLFGSNNAGQLMSALFEVLEELEVVEETGSGESRTSPLGIGRIGKVGDYDVSVLSVTPNATDIVMAENQFNEPPAPGNQFFMARVSVTYVGTATGTPWIDLIFQTVGNLSSSYTTFNNSCGVYPDEPSGINELFQGGSTEFNLCWQIDSVDQTSLVMYVEPLLEFDASPVWFSLGNPIQDVVDPNAETPEPTQAPVAGTTGAAATSVSVELVDIAYSPDQLTIPANTNVSLTVTNSGALQHTFNMDNPQVSSGTLNSGDSTTLTLNLPPGTYVFYCSIPGHREAGMEGTIIVE